MLRKVLFAVPMVVCMLSQPTFAKGLNFTETKSRLDQILPATNYEIGKLWQDLGIKPQQNTKDADFFGCSANLNKCSASDLTAEAQKIDGILNAITITQALDAQILLFDARSGELAGHFEYRMQKDGGPVVEFLGDDVFLIKHLGMSGSGVWTKEARVFVNKEGRVKEVGYFITEHVRSGWGMTFDAEIQSEYGYKDGVMTIHYTVVVTPAENESSAGSKDPHDNALRTKRTITAQIQPAGWILDKALSTTNPDEIEELSLGADAEYARFYGKVFDNWLKGFLNEGCGKYRYFHEYSDTDGKGVGVKSPDGDGAARVKRIEEVRTIRGLGTTMDNGDIPDIAIPPTAFPLKTGSRWANPDVGIDPRTRTDKMYYNFVEKVEDVTVPAGTFKKCFKIVYRSLPDDTTEWYCPGVGVVKIEYHHHGTIDNVLLELTEICGEPQPMKK